MRWLALQPNPSEQLVVGLLLLFAGCIAWPLMGALVFRFIEWTHISLGWPAAWLVTAVDWTRSAMVLICAGFAAFGAFHIAVYAAYKFGLKSDLW